ncbi:MAG: anaerobic ribonucleoside-triphosphate reductase activating protein [Rikenellaceae bacterium]
MALKFVSYDVVFQEVPDEVSLALNISGCPNRCPGCHSAHLMEDVGEELSVENITSLVERYRSSITCVCFMGGDAEPALIESLAEFVHSAFGLRSAWYSGREVMPLKLNSFDYIKLGDYREECGGLSQRTTNQRMYKVADGELEDITYIFWKNERI